MRKKTKELNTIPTCYLWFDVFVMKGPNARFLFIRQSILFEFGNVPTRTTLTITK